MPEINNDVPCSTSSVITELQHDISITTDMIADFAEQTTCTITNHKQAIEKLSGDIHEEIDLLGKVIDRVLECESRITELENKIKIYKGLLLIYGGAIIAIILAIICYGA